MGKKLTYEIVKNFIEIESKSGCKLISNEYIKNSEKLKIKCKCGKVYEAAFAKFKSSNKRRCNSCSNQEFWTPARAEKLLNQNGYQLIGKYAQIKANTKIQVKCPNNHEYTTDIHHFNSHKTRCPICKGGKVKTNDDFLEQLKEEVGDEYIPMEKYINAYTKIRMLHKTCMKEFYVSPSCFLSQGTRCTNCGSVRNSRGHKKITEYLSSKNLGYREETTFPSCKYKQVLHFDVRIEGRILIEYDGQQHFNPVILFGGARAFKKNKQKDQIKNQYCIANGIPLIRIPYWEFDNIEYILDNVLQHFDIINKTHTYDKGIVLKYLVDENWNHDEYINSRKQVVNK